MGRPIKTLSKQVVVLFLLLFPAGCSSLSTDLRKEGFDMFQRGLEAVPESPELHEVITLRNVTIHIVGHRKHFNYEKASAYGSPIAGYATPSNEIWLLGKVVEGKIVVDQAILGHELKHLLHYQNKKVANPDQLEAIGM